MGRGNEEEEYLLDESNSFIHFFQKVLLAGAIGTYVNMNEENMWPH
jgi:hypothetical protein